MSFIFFSVLALVIFFREVLLGVCLLLYRPFLTTDHSEILLRAMRLRPPQLWICKNLPVTSFSLPHFGSGSCFIRESFWKLLDEKERAALVFWLFTANRYESFWGRLFGFVKPDKIDRSALHWGVSAPALISVLEKSQKNPADSAGVVLQCFGLLGPSLFGTWEALEARIQRLGIESTKLQT